MLPAKVQEIPSYPMQLTKMSLVTWSDANSEFTVKNILRDSPSSKFSSEGYDLAADTVVGLAQNYYQTKKQLQQLQQPQLQLQQLHYSWQQEEPATTATATTEKGQQQPQLQQ